MAALHVEQIKGTPKHFLDLGGRRAVDLALHRLKAAGTIRQLARGLQALRHLGKDQVDDRVIAILRRNIDDQDRANLRMARHYYDLWCLLRAGV